MAYFYIQFPEQNIFCFHPFAVTLFWKRIRARHSKKNDERTKFFFIINIEREFETFRGKRIRFQTRHFKTVNVPFFQILHVDELVKLYFGVGLGNKNIPSLSS